MSQRRAGEVFLKLLKGESLSIFCPLPLWTACIAGAVETLAQLAPDAFFRRKLGNYKLEETSVDIELTEDTADSMTDEDKVVLEVSEMNVKEAKELILGNDEYEGILNIKVLKALQNEDNRKGVQDAVETQIAILYAREDEDGNPE